MCGCAERRAAIATGARALVRGDVSEVVRQAKAVAVSVRVDLEMARAAAATKLGAR